MYSIFGLGWVSNGLSDVICPQGSIVGPMVFNLYVPDLQITSHANHIYITHCVVKELDSSTRARDLNRSLTKHGL